MGMKRGASGKSLVVAVNKPANMTSHDVVNRVRKVFGERRVGHAGTLDPMASGVLPIMVGPATRLNKYLSNHDKSYVADIVFGVSTATDDREGEPIHVGSWPACITDQSFAEDVLRSFVGRLRQIPPIYSAIKVDGRRAYDAARSGNVVDIQPREIDVYSAALVQTGWSDAGYTRHIGEGTEPDLKERRDPDAKDNPEDLVASISDEDPLPFWRVRFDVSKGTYIRALARDIGLHIGVPAHLGALVRECAGEITLEDCVSLDALERAGDKADAFAVDPLTMLNVRLAFLDEALSAKVASGNFVNPKHLALYAYCVSAKNAVCCCMPNVHKSDAPLRDGELIAMVCHNALVALYVYDEASRKLKADCVFQKGVSRGFGI